MATAGYAELQITPTMKGARTTISKELQDSLGGAESIAKGSGDRTGKSFGQGLKDAFGGAAKAVGQTVLGAGAAAAAGITAWGASAVKAGIEFNTLGQTSRAALTSLLGSTEAANAQMSKLDDFAKTSPFAKSVFIDAQQQLIGFGMSAEKVVPTLDAIQNAVAATGGSSQQISDITLVLSQISAAGKITGTDLMQLAQRGINAADLIGSQMGKTGPEIKAAITAGTLDAGAALDALTAGMAEKFAGAAAGVKNTWTGATDRIKSATRDMGSALVEPFISQEGGGKAVEWANEIADLIRLLIPPAKEFAAMIADKISPTIDSLLGKAKGLLGNLDFSKATGSLSSMAPVIGIVGGAMAPLLGQLPLVGKLFTGLTGPIGIVLGLVAAMVAVSPELRTALGGAVSQIAEAFGNLGPLIGEIGELAGELLSQVGTVLADLITSLLPPIVDLLGGIIPPLTSIISVVGGALTQAISALTPHLGDIIALVADMIAGLAPLAGQLLAGLVPLITQLVTALLPPILQIVQTLLPLMVQVAQTILPPIVEIISALLPVIMEILQAITPIIPIIAELTATLLPPLLELFTGLLAPLLDLVQPIMDLAISLLPPLMDILMPIIDLLVAMIPTIVDLATPMVDQMIPAFQSLIDILTVVGDWIGQAIEWFADLMESNVTVGDVLTSVWTGITEFFTRTWESISGTASRLWDGIVTFFTSIPTKISTAVAPVGNLWKKFSDWIGQVKTAVTTKFDQVVTWIGSVPGKITNALGNLGSTLYNKGKDLITGLWDGIKAKFGAVKDWIGQQVDKIWPFSTPIQILPPTRPGTPQDTRTAFPAPRGLGLPSLTATPATWGPGSISLPGSRTLEDEFAALAASLGDAIDVHTPTFPKLTTTPTQGEVGARTVINVAQSIYNPVAEPASAAIDKASQTLALVGVV
jgi:tape measure domain-containing protein